MTLPSQETHQRQSAEELTCRPPEVLKEIKPRPLYELTAALGTERAEAARKTFAELTPAARRQRLRREWARLLGDVEPNGDPRATKLDRQRLDTITVERFALDVEPGLVVPLLLLLPERKTSARLPVVIAVAQQGKQAFLKNRSETLAALLDGGAAVCLPDLRGTGETQPGDAARGRSSASTSLAATELMLGQTLVGSWLRDLRSVLRYLRSREELDAGRIALWGDSFATANSRERNLAVPLDAERLPEQAEPIGGLLALFGALFEDDIRAVSIRGGLAGFRSLLESPFCYVPHDSIIPGALTAGDLCDVAGALAPRSVRMEALVDGRNREVSAETLAQTFEPARKSYRSMKAEHRFQLGSEAAESKSVSRWLLQQLTGE